MAATPAIKKLIDELGPIEAELGRLEAQHGIAGKAKRATALRSAIAEAANLKPEETAKVDGNDYAAVIGERRNESEVQKPAVFKLLGKAAFIKACGFTLAKLTELVTDELARAALVKKERTGSRQVKTYKLATNK